MPCRDDAARKLGRNKVNFPASEGEIRAWPKASSVVERVPLSSLPAVEAVRETSEEKWKRHYDGGESAGTDRAGAKRQRGRGKQACDTAGQPQQPLPPQQQQQQQQQQVLDASAREGAAGIGMGPAGGRGADGGGRGLAPRSGGGERGGGAEAGLAPWRGGAVAPWRDRSGVPMDQPSRWLDADMVRTCGHAAMRACGGRADTRTYGHADIRTRGHTDTRTYGRADMRTCGRADVRACGRGTWLGLVGVGAWVRTALVAELKADQIGKCRCETVARGTEPRALNVNVSATVSGSSSVSVTIRICGSGSGSGGGGGSGRACFRICTSGSSSGGASVSASSSARVDISSSVREQFSDGHIADTQELFRRACLQPCRG